MGGSGGWGQVQHVSRACAWRSLASCTKAPISVSAYQFSLPIFPPLTLSGVGFVPLYLCLPSLLANRWLVSQDDSGLVRVGGQGPQSLAPQARGPNPSPPKPGAPIPCPPSQGPQSLAPQARSPDPLPPQARGPNPSPPKGLGPGRAGKAPWTTGSWVVGGGGVQACGHQTQLPTLECMCACLVSGVQVTNVK